MYITGTWVAELNWNKGGNRRVRILVSVLFLSHSHYAVPFGVGPWTNKQTWNLCQPPKGPKFLLLFGLWRPSHTSPNDIFGWRLREKKIIKKSGSFYLFCLRTTTLNLLAMSLRMRLYINFYVSRANFLTTLSSYLDVAYSHNFLVQCRDERSGWLVGFRLHETAKNHPPQWNSWLKLLACVVNSHGRAQTKEDSSNLL